MINRGVKVISLLLFKQIAELFIAILMGVILVRARLLKAEDSKSLSVVALYLIMPCVIIEAFQIDYTQQVINGLLLAFAAAVLIHIVLIFLVAGLGRLFKMGAVEKASLMYSNAGNLIIPIVTSVLGKQWVIYSCAFISVQAVLLWSHGRMLLCGERKIKFKKIFLNINMIAIFIGLLLFLARIRLPSVLSGALSSVSVMIGPICMIVAGMLIGNMNPGRLKAYKRVYLVTFLKMILCPLLVLCLLKFSGMGSLTNNGNKILLISLLATITPCASTVTQMAQIYGRDAEYASVINVVTTLVCIVTMPLLVMLYQF
jgi:malate permease and related proteins